MIHIKSAAVTSTIKHVKTAFGVETFEQILAGCEPRTRELMGAPVVTAVRWIPVDALVNFMQGMVDTLGGGDERFIVQNGRFCAEDQFSGFYKVFLKVGSPGFLVKKAPMIMRTLFDTGEVSSTSAGKNQVTVRMSGFDPGHRLYRLDVMGWIQRALELSGAQDLAIEVSPRIDPADGSFEIASHWRS